ncbi:iron complex outermembrane recepter protein [Granulicella rosea]|uniref:Iron complex outermembrane recepter protein n=1 Tax=Granulicella rosea TaxID=474952 RepID=A0A239DHI1_9BACT|nr:TonB-dependent receptor [Granulicella rosea]SNS31173.1 iron complex outermembrane recepter protein [Granulicella rosea]
MKTLPFLLACLTPAAAFAQSAPAAQQPVLPPVAQTVDVTTSSEPLPLADPDRSVRLIDLADPARQPLFNAVEDYLRLDPSIQLQERSPGGVQADISIRGTTFEQTLVLVNGMRVNDPETAHLNLDLTVPLEAISRIDVLHGSGSTFYGSDAIGGAVNLITAPAPRTFAEIRLGGGSYNENEQHLRAAYLANPKSVLNSEQITASRDASDGFFYQGANDRGYHSLAAASDTFLLSPIGQTEILLAASDRPYGANLFYGDYDSKERTKGWYGAIRQEIARDTLADFAYRRHTDLFVLLASNPNYYRNNHIDTAWQADLRHTSHLAANLDLAYGVEADGDSILSSNLGHHARNQGAGYVNLSAHALGRLSLSVGARQEIYRGPTAVFSPSAAAGYAFGHGLRAHAAYGHGFRLPTYLDLYYSDPATIGNPNLKPETSQSFEEGLDWTHARLHASATAFQMHQSNGIDYSKYALTAPWQATNVNHITYTGAESALSYTLRGDQRIDLGYTFIHATPPPAGLISEYAYNYAAQNASLAYAVTVRHQLSARTQLGVIQKTAQSPYPLWSVALARSQGLIRPYLRMDNLSNTSYQETPGVPLPGRTLVGGLVMSWPAAR